MTLSAVLYKQCNRFKYSGGEVIYFRCAVAACAVDDHPKSGDNEEGRVGTSTKRRTTIGIDQYPSKSTQTFWYHSCVRK